MELDCRSRHGQSYGSSRRRISQSVANTLHVAAADAQIRASPTFDSDDGLLPAEESMIVTSDNDPVDAAINQTCYVIHARDDLAKIDDSSNDSDDDSIHFNYFDSSDSDDDSDDLTLDTPDIRNQLAEWAVDNNITHSALSSLLSILKQHHTNLPTDPRTLLKTPHTYNVKEIVGIRGQVGQYYHFGLAAGINELLSMFSGQCTNNLLTLQFNFDGLPLFKSASQEFWPILCLVKEFETNPFVVGLYCGAKKPPNIDDYVHDFVEELCNLLHTGIINDNSCYSIQVDCFVCDAPARAFIKNVKYHNGYHGCEKCTQEGVYDNNKMTFPETAARLRTDHEFVIMADEEHHRGPTPLSVVPVGLVTGFVFDYMHLVCLGVVRKLLKFWLGGNLHTSGDVASRLPGCTVETLSTRLLNLARFIPQEFARKPRALSEIDRWKATEFRQFLLYTGPVVLCGILTETVYNHFMLLFTGITLLTSPIFCKDYADYAHSLLVQFVELAGGMYESDFLVYNVHGLVHLAEDVKMHGSLDSFSAFPFENQLKSLKRLVRKADNPLAQCIRRLTEQRNFSSSKSSRSAPKETCSVEHSRGPVPVGYDGAVQFAQLRFNKFKVNIRRSPSDCCVAISDKGPVLVVNVLLCQEQVYVVCRPFKKSVDLFVYPLCSSSLGIYKVSGLSKACIVVPVSDILSKCVCLQFLAVDKSINKADEYAVFPIVHTVNTEKT